MEKSRSEIWDKHPRSAILLNVLRIKFLTLSGIVAIRIKFLNQDSLLFLESPYFHLFFEPEVGKSATCSAMRISATCASRKFAADVRFNPQAADCGIAPAH